MMKRGPSPHESRCKLTASHPRKKPDKGGKSTHVTERTKDARRQSRLSVSEITRLASHITERDRRIALDCFEHNVLTTDQIRRLYFTNTRIAQVRLQRLYELRVLERFRPAPRAGEGSNPYHWILDEAGALLVADWKGIDRSELRYTRDDGQRIAGSRNLTHHVEANEFFTRLSLEASAAGGELAEWYGVRTLAHLFSGVIVPDGYGVLALRESTPLHILLELDRSTETAQVLREGQAIRRDTSPQQPARPPPTRDPSSADCSSRTLRKYRRSKHSRAAQRHRLEPRDAPPAAFPRSHIARLMLDHIHHNTGPIASTTCSKRTMPAIR
jgi:hypothetical protein